MGPSQFHQAAHAQDTLLPPNPNPLLVTAGSARLSFLYRTAIITVTTRIMMRGMVRQIWRNVCAGVPDEFMVGLRYFFLDDRM